MDPTEGKGSSVTVVVEVTFPFGYVHATPWGRHVNEGFVEWPLSPWRLLRGLVSVWKTLLPELAEDAVLPVLRSLSELPEIDGALRAEGSIRSYLPAEGHRSGAFKPDTDLVVDSFASVRPGTGISYRWSADLDQRGRDVLSKLVCALPYLGRAESLCDGSVRFDNGQGAWSRALADDSGVGSRTLVPTLPFDLDELCVSIGTMRRGGRLLPPGARWVRYETDAPIAAASSSVRPTPAPRVQAARFALSGPAPVSVRQTVVVAETMRRATMSQFGDQNDGATSEVLAGKDAAGVRLEGNRHAHWLPLDLDHDRLIDSILVWALDGLGSDDLAALSSIRRLRFHGGDRLGSTTSLNVALEAAGDLDELGLAEAKMIGPAVVWRSLTPFLPQRHRKRQSLEAFLHECVGRELRARGLNTKFEITELRGESWGSYRRHRRQERMAQARPGFGLKLHFAEPPQTDGGAWTQPICIGQLAHFGMGRFGPVR